ncbi:MAG TPA: prepilin-type N-terminal cleavage/methylation domain-containing protein [Candidatus Paceibacterota bacterium]
MKLPSIFHPVRNKPAKAVAAKCIHGRFLTGQAQNKNRGLTLIEITVVLAIMAGLATIGLIVGVDSYSRYNFHSAEDTAVSMLQKARSEAINNIGESPHGVYFADLDNLILFYGSTYTPGSDELKIEKPAAVSYSGASEMVFNQLSGNTSGGTVTINSANITINNEGGIDW